jgi:hypothetical protein
VLTACMGIGLRKTPHSPICLTIDHFDLISLDDV